MKLLDSVRIIPRSLKADKRGWFLKVIDGHEADLPRTTGEVYVTAALPGEIRGNHFHRLAAEWFTVIMGEAVLALMDPGTGESRLLRLNQQSPQTVYVPPGIGHAFKNPENAREQMVLIAYADHLYDPTDTIPMKVI